MLGDLPLGAEPLGGFGDIIPVPEGGAAKFPAPFLQIEHDLSKYHRFWFKRFLEDFSKVGLPEEEANKPTISELLGWDKLRD
jgi:hypothetical protein